MTQKKANKRYVSPTGVAIWPRLNAPDTKFNADGEFSAKLAMDESDAEVQAFIKKMTVVRDEAFEQFKSENPKHKKATLVDFWGTEVDDEGDETGRITFNFKMKHKVKAKKTGKVYTLVPSIINAKREVLKNPPNIGGGSILKVSFEAIPYFAAADKKFGISLRMVAVQIIKLVEFGGASRAADDFDEEEGDDIADGADRSDDDDSDDDSSDGDDGDDGDY
ncbi:ssDNA-binding protein [Xanthomonas tesorieronis]|uniref:ssDNA-binding protein n=1 Tax=Xanthomonas tesorieronis TaxID=3160839 RepID=UPI003511BED6